MTQTRKQKILGDVKKARRRRTLTTTAIVVVLMIAIVVGIILLQRQPSPPSILGTTISQSMYGYLSGVSNATLNASTNQVNAGVTPLQSVTTNLPLLNGKPEFLYIGAEFCPFCAAERWGIIVALSKFGTFTGLTYMLSSATDVDPNTPTFSFVQASYSSPYIAFVSVETQDRNHNPLQTLDTQDQSLLNNYDCNSTNQCGGIPFIDVGGKYLLTAPPNQGPNAHSGSQFDPGILANQNWTQIGPLLDSSSSGVAMKIDGTADTLISAICRIDGGNPGNICSQAYAGVTQAPISIGQMPLPLQTNFIQISDATVIGKAD